MASKRAHLSLGVAGALVWSLGGCTGSSERPDPTPAPSRTVESPPPSKDPLTDAEQVRLNERLVAAAWDNDVPLARRLIRRGADVNWRDATQQSAFLIAASEGHLRLLGLTLANGADVDLHDRFDGTALIRATERGHWDVAGRLLQTPIDIDHINNLGWTALLESIILGGSADHLTTVRVLVAAGADAEIVSQRDQATPVDLARAKGQLDVVTLLTQLDRPEVRKPNQALLKAAETGDAALAALALRAGANLEARDERRRTPLLLAVTHDRLEVARILVALGASPDAVDDQQDTPWLVTGVTGSVRMATLLLRFNPDLDLLNRFGGTSIIPASERGHVAYVERVARTNIDINHINNLGWTALLEAVILGDGSKPYRSIVNTLLEAGADPTIADRQGTTPLEHARSRGHLAMTRLLEGVS